MVNIHTYRLNCGRRAEQKDARNLAALEQNHVPVAVILPEGLNSVLNIPSLRAAAPSSMYLRNVADYTVHDLRTTTHSKANTHFYYRMTTVQQTTVAPLVS